MPHVLSPLLEHHGTSECPQKCQTTRLVIKNGTKRMVDPCWSLISLYCMYVPCTYLLVSKDDLPLIHLWSWTAPWDFWSIRITLRCGAPKLAQGHLCPVISSCDTLRYSWDVNRHGNQTNRTLDQFDLAIVNWSFFCRDWRLLEGICSWTDIAAFRCWQYPISPFQFIAVSLEILESSWTKRL